MGVDPPAALVRVALDVRVTRRRRGECGRLWIESAATTPGRLEPKSCGVQSWVERQAELAAVADRTLFFVDGQPRSGTTWLQQMLDGHPDVCCRGEAMFRDHLAVPLDRVMRARHQELHNRNVSIFRHTGGYPLPDAGDTQFLLGTAILSAFRDQSRGGNYLAIGEKTPGNIFFFPQLQSLFPHARLISIARDPRDVITSNWHRFQSGSNQDDAAKAAFIGKVLPLAGEWMRTMLAFRERYPDNFRVVTYENLHRAPAETLAGLFRFLRVSDAGGIVSDCIARTAFARQTGGRPAGVAEDGSFFRKGVVGDWPSTLTPAMNETVLRALGWSFPHFGWTP
jgi:hypothetical protein